MDRTKYQTLDTCQTPGEYTALAVALDVAMACQGDECPCGCMSYRYHVLFGTAWVPVAIASGMPVVTESNRAGTMAGHGKARAK